MAFWIRDKDWNLIAGEFATAEEAIKHAFAKRERTHRLCLIVHSDPETGKQVHAVVHGDAVYDRRTD